MSTGQGFGYSLFGNSIKSNDVTAINNYANALKNGTSVGEAWRTTMTGTSVAAKQYVLNARKAGKSTTELTQGLNNMTLGAKASTVAMKALGVAKNIALNVGVMLLITGITKAIDALVHAQERAAEKAQEAARETSEQSEKSTEAVESLIKLKTQLAEGSKSSDELTSAFKEQLKAMGYTEEQIDALIGKYGGLAGAMDEATRKALEKARTDAHTDVATSGKSLETTYDPNGMFGDTKSTVRLTEFDPLRDEILEIMKPVAIDTDSLMSTITMGANSDSAEDIYAYYQGLRQVVQLIQETASKTNNEELLNSSVYKEASETLKELGESAKLYGDAINRLHSADAKIELADYLKANDINSKEAFDSYIKRIQNSTEYSDAYKQVLIDVANDAFPQFSNSAKDAGENVNKMTVSLSELEGASGKIKTLGSAFKELSDDGYITTKTLGEIQTATGLSGDEWAEYESKLLNAKKGSAEFSQIMADLTYKMLDQTFANKDLNSLTEQQISAILRENGVVNADAVAHDWLTKAKETLRIKTALAKASTTEAVVALATEASQAGITGNALNDLILDMGIFNNTNLDVSQKVAALQEMGYYARWTAQGLADIDKVKKYTVGGKDVIASYDENGKLLGIEEEKQVEIPNVEIPKITIPNYSGATSGGKSGSNGRDKDADPLKADIDRYVLLQNAVDEAEQSLKRLESTEEGLHGSDKLKNIEQQAEAYERIAQAYNDMAWENKQERNDIRWRMEQQGFVFSGDFDSTNLSTNYSSHLQAMYDKYNAMPYKTEADKDSRAKFLETIKDMEDGYKRILALNKEVYDNENKSIDALKGHNKEIQIQRQYWEDFVDDQISDIEHQIDIRKSRVTPSFDDDISDYEKIKEIAHQRANDWRALDYDDNSPEVQKWQKTWLDADAKIKDAFNDTLDKIERATKKETGRLQELADEAGKLVEKYEALKQVKSSQFDFDNSMVEALQDIDNQLATSLVSAQYLDPDERSLIFNEEDYKLLSGKIKDLQEWNERAAQAYWNEINNLGEDELYLKESITAEYERQLALKNKELEVYKAEVDVKKKEQALNNVLAEKNVKMIVGDHWEWVADVDKVRQATEEANLARNRLTTAKTKKLQQLELNKHDELIAKSNEEQAAYEQQIKIIEKATEKLKEAYEDYVDPVEDIGVLVNQLKNKGISGFSDALNHLTSVMGGASINYGTGNNSSYNSYVGGSSSSGGSRLSKTTYTYVKGNDGRTYEVMDGSRTNGEGTVVKGKDSNGNTTYTNNYGEIVKTVKKGYASGTKFASPGWHKVDENGQETYVSDDGVFHNFAGGELVFNNDQVQRLFEFSKYAPQNMMAEMVSKYATPMINLPVKGAGGGNITYQFNGGIHIDEVADYNDFMLQLTQKANAIHQITKNE